MLNQQTHTGTAEILSPVIWTAGVLIATVIHYVTDY